MKPDEKYREAVQAFQAGDLDKAERLCRQLISAAPTLAPAFYLQGVIALRKNDSATAVRAFKRAVALDDKVPGHHRELARAYAGAGQIAEAYEAARAGVAKYPRDGDLLDLLGALSYDRGYTDAFVDAYRRAYEVAPTKASVLSNYGVALLEAGRLDEAIELLERARQLEASEANLLRSAGAFLAKGKADLALAVINQLLPPEKTTKQLVNLRKEYKLHADLRHALPSSYPSPTPADPDVLQTYASMIRAAIGTDSGADLFVVFFHVAQTKAHVASATHEEQADYVELLAIAAAAAHKIAANTKVVLLTDAGTQIPDASQIDYLIRLPFRREWIMYERMRAQWAFAASGCMTANTLFVDTDVVVGRSFDPIFAQDFDVGLTWRGNMPRMPVNGGMILARAGRGEAVAKFFAGGLVAYEAMVALGMVSAYFGYDIREFQGDQLAIYAFLNWATPPGGPQQVTIGDTKVRFFPCEEVNYNFRPTLDPAVVAQKFALHFKGPTKKYARDFVKSL